VLWSNELCHLRYARFSEFSDYGMTWWSMNLMKLFSSKISNKQLHKVKSKVYFIFSSRCFCGEGFKAKQTNGSDFSIHLAIPFFVLFIPDTVELTTKLASAFTKLLSFGFLFLRPEWSQVYHVEKNFGNDDGASLNAKMLLLSAFLIFTMHWSILSEIIPLLASKLPSSIDLLGLL
jgi:hypothetical protein